MRKKKEECKSFPAWLTSFSDLMPLLLTFFILLYSMSSLDISKAAKFLSYFQGERAKYFRKFSVVKPIKLYTKDLARKLGKILAKLLPISGYQIVVTKQYVMLRLFNRILFKKDSIELTTQAKKTLDQIAETIRKIGGNYTIKVEGFTDINAPSKKIPGIKDAWDLSLRRATTVVRYLISKGIPPDKLTAVGYGDTRPLYVWNNPILRSRNRRVEIYIQVSKERKDIEKQIQEEYQRLKYRKEGIIINETKTEKISGNKTVSGP
ncbi:OmpA/MotB family protein [Desulfurobacterium sp.]